MTLNGTIAASTRCWGRAARNASAFRTPFWRLTTTVSLRMTDASVAPASAVCADFTVTRTSDASRAAAGSLASLGVLRDSLPSSSLTTRPFASSPSTRGRPISVTFAPAAASLPPTQHPIAPAPKIAIVTFAEHTAGTRDALLVGHEHSHSRTRKSRLRHRMAPQNSDSDLARGVPDLAVLSGGVSRTGRLR